MQDNDMEYEKYSYSSLPESVKAWVMLQLLCHVEGSSVFLFVEKLSSCPCE